MDAIDLSSANPNNASVTNIDLVNNFYSQTPFTSIKILMVSPEYPPINGGVGRYTYNLM